MDYTSTADGQLLSSKLVNRQNDLTIIGDGDGDGDAAAGIKQCSNISNRQNHTAAKMLLHHSPTNVCASPIVVTGDEVEPEDVPVDGMSGTIDDNDIDLSQHSRCTRSRRRIKHATNQGCKKSVHPDMVPAKSSPNVAGYHHTLESVHPKLVPTKSAPDVVGYQQLYKGNEKMYQEKDWKTGRIWVEDDHSSTTSTATDSQCAAKEASTPNTLDSDQDETLDEEARYKMYRDSLLRAKEMQAKAEFPSLLERSTSIFDELEGGETEPMQPEFPSLLVQQTAHFDELEGEGGEMEFLPEENGTQKKCVRFSTIQIRTYETIMGDNPSCSTGPALSLGWRYDPNDLYLSCELYEYHRAKRYGYYHKFYPVDFLLNKFQREEMLLRAGYTRHDLIQNVRRMGKVKSQREQTLNTLYMYWFEERAESMARVVGRFVTKRERTRHLYDKWKKEGGLRPKASAL